MDDGATAGLDEDDDGGDEVGVHKRPKRTPTSETVPEQPVDEPQNEDDHDQILEQAKACFEDLGIHSPEDAICECYEYPDEYHYLDSLVRGNKSKRRVDAGQRVFLDSGQCEARQW